MSQSAHAIPSDLLQNMKTNLGHSILELSQKHKVLLLFLRHLGCIFCKWSLHEIGTYITQLLANNVLPVMVHQETSDTYERFLQNYDALADVRDVLERIPHVADPTGTQYYKQFGLPSPSFLWVMSRPDTHARISAVKQYGYTKPNMDLYRDTNRCEKRQVGGCFLIVQGRILNSYRFQTAADPLDLLLFSLGPSLGEDSSKLIPSLSSSPRGTASSTAQLEDEAGSNAFGPSKQVVMDIAQLTSIRVFDKKSLATAATGTAAAASAIDSKFASARARARIMRYSIDRQFSLSCISIDMDDTKLTHDSDDAQQSDGGKMLHALESDQIRKYWLVFVSSEFNSENLLFWQAVDRFRRVDAKQRLRDAQRIIDTYFDPTAILGINTSSKILEDVCSKLQQHLDDDKDLPQDLFDTTS